MLAQIVLANGSISNISYASHPDLYWALRGGGSNFGIITRFALEVFPQEPMWGGANLLLLSGISDQLSSLGLKRSFSLSSDWLLETVASAANRLGCLLGYCTSLDVFTNAFEQLAVDIEADPYAQGYVWLFIAPYVHLYAAGYHICHGGALVDSPSFKTLQAIKPVYSTNRLSNNTDLSKEITGFNPRGNRYVPTPSQTHLPNFNALQNIKSIKN